MIVSAGLSWFSNRHQYRRVSGFPYWTAGLLLTGSTRYAVGGTCAIRRAPFLTFVRPDAPYHVAFEQTAGECSGELPGELPGTLPGMGMVWETGNIIFMPRQSWHVWLDLPSDLPGICGVPIPDHAEGRLLIQTFRQMVGSQNAQASLRHELIENTLEMMILLANRFSPNDQKSRMDERIRTVANRLAVDYMQPWTVQEMAQTVYLSPSRFAHLFREAMGVTPMRYLEHQRMVVARELLLSTNQSVGEISRRVGYADPLYFSARFRITTGQSPCAYRQHPMASPDGSRLDA